MLNMFNSILLQTLRLANKIKLNLNSKAASLIQLKLLKNDSHYTHDF